MVAISFSVGELVAFLRLDDRQFQQAIKAAPASAKAAGLQIDQSMVGASKATDQVATSTAKASAATRMWAATSIGGDKLTELKSLGVSTGSYLDAVTLVPGAQDRVRAALQSSGLEAGKLNLAYADLDAATLAASTQVGVLGGAAETSAAKTTLASTASAGLATAAGDAAVAVSATTAAAQGSAAALAGSAASADGLAASLGAVGGAADAAAASEGAVGAAGAAAGAAGAAGLGEIAAGGAAAARGAEAAATGLADVARGAVVAEAATVAYASSSEKAAAALAVTGKNPVADGTLGQAAVIAAAGLSQAATEGGNVATAADNIATSGEKAKESLSGIGDASAKASTVSSAAMIAVAESTDDAAAASEKLAEKQKDAGEATAETGKAAEKTGNAFVVMAAVVAGAGIVSYLKSSIAAGSDLNETMSKSQQIFGAAAKSIQDFGKSAPQALGLSSGAAIDAATNFGNVYTQLGFTSDAAAKMSKATVQMAADLGSFNNAPTAEVADKISGALNGEYDSLQRMIPGINAARVQTEAMTLSGKASADQLTAQDKATAVLAIIQKDGAAAMGDYARTATGFANSQKTATAEIQSQKEALGQELLPVVQTFMGILQSVGIPLLGGFGDALAAVGAFALPLVKILGDVISWFTALPAPVVAATIAIAAVALLSGPLAALWLNIKSGATTAALSFMVAADGATGAAAGMNVAAAAASKAGLALKGAFLSNPIGLAIIGITTAFALFSGGADEASSAADGYKQHMDDLTSTLEKNTGAVTENTRAAIASKLGDDKLHAIESLGIATKDYTDAILGNADAQKRVQAGIVAAAQAAVESSSAYRDLATQLSAAGVSSEDLAKATLNQNFDAINDKIVAYNAGLSDSSQSMTLLTGATAQGSDALDSLSGVTQTARQAYVDLNGETAVVIDAQGHWATQARATQGAVEDQTSALGNLTPAAQASAAKMADLAKVWDDGTVSGSELAGQVGAIMLALDALAGRNGDAEAQQRVLNDAMRSYADGLVDVGAESRDVEAATLRLTEAKEKQAEITGRVTDKNYTQTQKDHDLQQAALDVADATDAVTKAQHNQGSAADKSASQADTLRNAMLTQATAAANNAIASGNVAGAHDAAAAAAQNAIDKFIAMQSPEDIASGKAKDMALALFGIPDVVATQVTVETSAAMAKLLEVSTFKIKDKTFNIYANQINQGGAAHSGVGYSTGMASGGEVTGGVPGQDSVPLLGMPGEWMSSKRVVDKMGGPAGMASWTRGVLAGRVQRLASGGLVQSLVNAPAMTVAAPYALSGSMGTADAFSLRTELNGLRGAIIQLAQVAGGPRVVQLAGGDVTVVEASGAEPLQSQLFRLQAAVR